MSWLRVYAEVARNIFLRSDQVILFAFVCLFFGGSAFIHSHTVAYNEHIVEKIRGFFPENYFRAGDEIDPPQGYYHDRVIFEFQIEGLSYRPKGSEQNYVIQRTGVRSYSRDYKPNALRGVDSRNERNATVYVNDVLHDRLLGAEKVTLAYGANEVKVDIKPLDGLVDDHAWLLISNHIAEDLFPERLANAHIIRPLHQDVSAELVSTYSEYGISVRTWRDDISFPRQIALVVTESSAVLFFVLFGIMIFTALIIISSDVMRELSSLLALSAHYGLGALRTAVGTIGILTVVFISVLLGSWLLFKGATGFWGETIAQWHRYAEPDYDYLWIVLLTYASVAMLALGYMSYKFYRGLVQYNG
ncbi:hypothetical protein HH1059_25160 [Halorhodospira halochloris]|uniref:Uncharacterized protein n=1 Tax=Halorhodospira halochloris TaxID=1052 RepID=A0A110B6Q7_HALHR|nr:hypothetical protein [Halorhodospira halochloris]MBK1650904.1 hypothetical protein [Halorhodospira halochloris]BAU56593.1 hypothetical protein HH1059_25160 [Halorhodospira halochloris]